MEENFVEKKYNKTKTFLFIAIAVIALAVSASVLFYVFGSSNQWLGKLKKIIPFPAVVINEKTFISANDLEKNLLSVKHFYEKQDFSKAGMRVDFTTAEGQKRLKLIEKETLNKMIENAAIKIIARENKLKISDQMAEQSLGRKIKEAGDEKSLRDNLRQLYDWDIEDFKDRVVLPSLYAEELEKIVMEKHQEHFSQEARRRIEEAKNHLVKKSDFAETAKIYSDGLTAKEGGNMGWIKKSQLMPEIFEAVSKLEVGEKSDVIESALGYHIVKLKDSKIENGHEMVNLQQIIVRKTTFADWLNEEIGKMRIYIPLREYVWNREKRTIDFTDEDLKEFEKKSMENYQGDMSIIF